MKRWIKKNEACIRRSVRTFLQASFGVFFTGLASGEFELFEWKTWIVTLGGSAIASGIAAVMNRKETGGIA